MMIFQKESDFRFCFGLKCFWVTYVHREWDLVDDLDLQLMMEFDLRAGGLCYREREEHSSLSHLL